MSNNSDNSSDPFMLNDLEGHDIAVLIYLIFIVFLGSVGNAFVCYIYYYKLDWTTVNLLVTILGFCDFFSSIVCAPMDLLIILHPYTFRKDISCRIIRFIDMNVNVISALIVFAISVDRFKKVVRPLGKQITRQQVLPVCLVIVFNSTALSLPCLFMDMTGIQCTLSEKAKGRLLYIVFLILTCSIVFMSMSAIYCIVGFRLCRYRIQRQSILGSASTWSSRGEISVVGETEFYIKEQKKLDEIKKAKADKEDEDTDADEIPPKLERSPSRSKQAKSFANMTRTTLIMFMVSFNWLISFLPHLTVVIILALHSHTLTPPEEGKDPIYNICLRSFYFNNVANPWVYAIFNHRFRREISTAVREATGR